MARPGLPYGAKGKPAPGVTVSSAAARFARFGGGRDDAGRRQSKRVAMMAALKMSSAPGIPAVGPHEAKAARKLARPHGRSRDSAGWRMLFVVGIGELGRNEWTRDRSLRSRLRLGFRV